MAREEPKSSGYHYRYTADGRDHYLDGKIGDKAAAKKAAKDGARFVSFRNGPTIVRILDAKTGAKVYG